MRLMDAAEVDQRPHPSLQTLRTSLRGIHDAILNYQPVTDNPPILDSSIDVATSNNRGEDGQWTRDDGVVGLSKLRDCVRIDLDILEKFLDDPSCASLPPLSTNAPYLIAVWHEVLCGPTPVEAIFKSFPLDGPPANQRQRGAQKPPAAKVDVVADGGKRWIRINTVKNSRLLAEFREIDSYLTDSDDSSYEDSPDARPSLAQTEFDNSVLQMGRSLLTAARANPIDGVAETPQVTLRLTRLKPSFDNEDGEDTDPRIARTVRLLQEMGINVELGERTESEFPGQTVPPSPTPSVQLEPTLNINLDLSVLIALISDLTHAPLPKSIEEANKRYIPPAEYREWKKKKNNKNKDLIEDTPSLDHIQETLDSIDDLPKDLRKQSRALTNQLLQEMGRGLLQELHDKISAISSSQEGLSATAQVKFWTTLEARERCLRIISKIGGPSEKRRAHALFSSIPSNILTGAAAEDSYWQSSRYPPKFLPLFPINFFPPSSTPDTAHLPDLQHISLSPPMFSRILAKTCKDILAQETMPHPRALPDELTTDREAQYDALEIQRATVTKANPRLTAHTVQSFLWGAELGWTTLTANKASIKAILREIKLARVSGRLDGIVDKGLEGELAEKTAAVWVVDAEGRADDRIAAMWVVDPRSLAEGMSSMSS